MRILKRRVMFGNLLIFFLIVFVVMGLTACSGTGNPTANPVASEAKLTEKKDVAKEMRKPQETQELQEVQAASTLTPIEQAHIDTGRCGKDAVWTYDGNNRILYITGTGIVDGIINDSRGFREFNGSDQIRVKEIHIEEGITALDAGPLFLNVYADDSEELGSEMEEVKLFLPDSLEKIGAATFDYRDHPLGIRHIHLPCGVRYLDGGAFWGMGDDKMDYYDGEEDREKKKLNITVDSSNPFYTVKDGVLFTKDQKTLVYYPSEKRDSVYHIPKSVTKIKPLAFARNFYLEEVVLPSDLKVIGAGAFYYNSLLSKINLEQAVKIKSIRDFDGIEHKIYRASTGKEEAWESGYDADTESGYCDFSECMQTIHGYYRDTTQVRKDAYFLGTFEGTRLESISFSDELKYVSYNTFKGCADLKKISIGKSYAGEINPDNICDRKGFSLYSLPPLEIQVSGENPYYIVKNHVLYSRDGKVVYRVLSSYQNATLVLDKKVQKIARAAITGHTTPKILRKVIVLGDLKQISKVAFAASNIESFEVTGNVDQIAPAAFHTCNKLKRFICHGSVKHIGKEAFCYAENLEKLSLGKKIKSIGRDAFQGCRWIEKPRVKKK